MKNSIAELVTRAVGDLPGLAGMELPVDESVERTRDPQHGEFASNVAMRLAKIAKKNPRDLAQEIVNALPPSELIEKTEIAGPGFINFYLTDAALQQQVAVVLKERESFGRTAKLEAPKVLLEYVSANPTGPLHVGHGRLAAYGATLGNILEAAGYEVSREYYVNDAGRQMDILGLSVWLRMLESAGLDTKFPEGGYRGEYIRDIAAKVDADAATDIAVDELMDGVPEDGPDGDKDQHLDGLIAKAKSLIGEERFGAIRQYALESIRDEIREDLAEFGVEFDSWYSEQGLYSDNRVGSALESLKEHDVLYEKDGATWFRAESYGDEKDRVVVRDNGVTTYFASDIAYHAHKRQRGFGLLLDVLGSDHHGYLARVRAGLQAMGFEGESLEVQLVQFVTLYRSGVKQSMGTRSGNFVTLRELREEVGNDAARFFYVMRSNDQHLDFDLDLAKSRANDNPVYYIQYAHARVASVFRQLEEKSMSWNRDNAIANLDLLNESHELALLNSLSRYPEVVALSAKNRSPQNLVHFLRDLANEFHTYYNAHTFIVDDAALRDARLALSEATRQVIANGLALLGVSAPTEM